MSERTRWPAVTCLCPTYGRYEHLRDALACFQAQAYPGPLYLLISNDAPVPIGTSEPHVEIYNREKRFETLGHKRQALLRWAQTPIVAHWDDDDIYLPWHVRRSVEALLEANAGCVKSKGAWYVTGPREDLHNHGEPHHNVFEGTMVFRRQEALDIGGYDLTHSGQAKALLRRFKREGRLHKIEDKAGRGVSYCYRWGNDVGHISGIGNEPDAADRHARRNQDWGDGEPLTPRDLTPYWDALPSPVQTTIKATITGG